MKNVLALALLASLALLSQGGPASNLNNSKNGAGVAPKADEMWISQVPHGESAFHARPDDFQVYRNVMDFGCAGDGVTDDTACISRAISTGGRCGEECGSSTIEPAIVYFPSGTYLISSAVVMYYYTQLIGNANDPPTLLAAPGFNGPAVLDANPYYPGCDCQWYINQNNFFRQVRNFVIDISQTPATAGTNAIHWQVSQATSLLNVRFVMSKEANSNHRGIWIENGSGGFMSDLTFEGGRYGMLVGNQQFLSKNLVFNDCQTAISIHWNWQWTFKSVQFNRVGVAIDITATSNDVASGVGSVLLLDSVITDSPIGVQLINSPHSKDDTSGTVLLDHVTLVNVGAAVADQNGGTILPGGSQTIRAWSRGSLYTDRSGSGQFNQGDLPQYTKSANLLDAQGNFFDRVRPQYETVPASDFVNIKDYGAFGNGREDDSTAIQLALNEIAGSGKILYFPHGAYIITRTVTVHPGTRMIGELWSLLMATGPAFQDAANPQPMLRVGAPGQLGDVEITDFMFSTKGSTPGVILVEWNIRSGTPGSAGIWDSHFRVGGFAGTELQYADCPRGQGYTPKCACAFLLFHITETGSGYFENVWAWTADHDLDNGLAQSQISIYAGRGVLVESVFGPNWMYGIQSEHNIMYQYQLSNTQNLFLTMIQGETPYWQPGPKAPEPFAPNPKYHDPTYGHCAPDSSTCALSYGLRAHGSSNVYLYGAGLYNFFNNYDQTCLDTGFDDCQDSMINLEGNTNFYGFNLNTKAAKNIIVEDDTKVLAANLDNRNGFCQTVGAFF